MSFSQKNEHTFTIDRDFVPIFASLSLTGIPTPQRFIEDNTIDDFEKKIDDNMNNISVFGAC